MCRLNGDFVSLSYRLGTGCLPTSHISPRSRTACGDQRTFYAHMGCIRRGLLHHLADLILGPLSSRSPSKVLCQRGLVCNILADILMTISPLRESKLCPAIHGLRRSRQGKEESSSVPITITSVVSRRNSRLNGDRNASGSKIYRR